MDTPKLCIDCKHYKSRNCYHPSNGIDLVEGNPKSELCALMRLDSYACKTDGLLFEAAEPVIYDIRELFPDVIFPNLVRTNNE